jgi:hypothetical protein
MIYPQLSGEPNFVLIGVSAVFGLLIIIIIYYIVTSKKLISKDKGKLQDKDYSGWGSDWDSDSGSKVSNPSFPMTTNESGMPSPTYDYSNIPKPTITSLPVPTLSNRNIKQVFNIKENIYTLDDAPAVCGAMGAELASVNELIDAHKKGADWCNVGWTRDGLAAYPIQQSTWKKLQDNNPNSRAICGKPGINLVRNDPNLLYGVNCYGIKPEPKGNEKVKTILTSDKDVALNAKIAEFQQNLASIGVGSFNNDNWSQ